MAGVPVMISWADEEDEILLDDVPFDDLGAVPNVVYSLFSSNPGVSIDSVAGYLVMNTDSPLPVFYRVIVEGTHD